MANLGNTYTKKKCDEVTTYVSTRSKIKDPDITVKYYDLVTDFFEYGWGKSFHFAPQKKGEKTKEAMVRHEWKIAESLHLKPGMKVLDVGCGIGGPMKTIAEKSGAQIVGLNLNAYQIAKGEKYMRKHGLEKQCSFHLGNFMKVDLPDASFDAIYAIESTPHAPDRTKCFKEMARLLKPGGRFAGYEYALLDSFEEKNPDHLQIIEDLEHGGGLQKVPSIEQIKKSLLDAEFHLLALEDLCKDGWTWTLPLEKGIRSSRAGRTLTNVFVRILEFLTIAPQGSTQVSTFLNLAADAFVEAGKRKIFTPCLFFLCEKKS